MRVRRLGADDVDVLRDVRLRALQDAPEAFWTSYEREVAYGPDDWRQWLTKAAFFVAAACAGDGTGDDTGGAEAGEIVGGEIVGGLAGGMPAPDDPSATYLIAMWVAPEHRGSGVAAPLVSAVTAWAASEGRPTVVLYVEEHHARARRFYERVGFRLTGRRLLRERDGHWELEMVLPPPVPARGQ